jgi:uncharacterized membrane protein YkvA (DUF1232 family)
MTTVQWLLLGFGIAFVLYAGFVLFLIVAGRRSEARAVGGVVPDCLLLFRRLLADERVSRWRKALLVALVLYLAMPIDLVPDFIPIAGQLDDVVLVVLVLRVLLRGGGAELVREHWPGPESSLRVILKLAYG